MKSKTAGERKRTVTVVVGPKTVELMERLNNAIGGLVPGAQRQGAVGLAGACIDVALKQLQKEWLPEDKTGHWSHYD